MKYIKSAIDRFNDMFSVHNLSVSFPLIIIGLFIFWQFGSSDVLSTTTTTGGDTVSHNWGPYYLKEHLLPSLTGWTQDWFGGMPAFTFYMVVPHLFIALLSFIVDPNIAFKLITISGTLLIPYMAYLMGKLGGLRRPTPVILAILSLVFLYDDNYTIGGGNILGSLAGEFAESLGLAFAVLYIGLLLRGLDTGKGRTLSAVFLALAVLCHPLAGMFASLATLAAFIFEPKIRNLRWVLIVFGLGAMFSSFWTVPFILRRNYTTSIGWTKGTEYSEAFFRGDWWWIMVLAFVGCIFAFVYNLRLGKVLTLMSVWLIIIFRFYFDEFFFVDRFLPLYYLCLIFLAALGVGLSTRSIILAFKTRFNPSSWQKRILNIFVAGSFIGGVVLHILKYIPYLELDRKIVGWILQNDASSAESFFSQLVVLSRIGMGGAALSFLIIVALPKALDKYGLFDRQHLSGSQRLSDRQRPTPVPTTSSITASSGASVKSSLVKSSSVKSSLVKSQSAGQSNQGSSKKPSQESNNGTSPLFRFKFLNNLKPGKQLQSVSVLLVSAFTLLGVLVAVNVQLQGSNSITWERDGRYGIHIPGLQSVLTTAAPASPARGWAEWNYSGFENKTASSYGPGWSEYSAIVETMRGIGEERGCGRALWEYQFDRMNSHGSPFSRNLFAFWTDGCITTIDGLYTESSATAPFYYISLTEVSKETSQIVRGRRYPQRDPANVASAFDEGVEHLKLLGVNYYIASSIEFTDAADAHPDLIHLASYPTDEAEIQHLFDEWGYYPHSIYMVKGSEPVEPLEHEPAIVGDTDWLDRTNEWWLDPERRDVFLLESGPDSYQEASFSQPDVEPYVPDAVERKRLEPVVVSNVKIENEKISFSVDKVGVPILVKVSYYPNWEVSGAKGPYRASPNWMVVIPTENEVVLNYTWTSVEYLGYGLTAAGIVLAVLLYIWDRRRRLMQLRQPPNPLQNL